MQQILNDSSAEVESNSSDFWVMVAALKVCSSKMVVTSAISLLYVNLVELTSYSLKSNDYLLDCISYTGMFLEINTFRFLA